MFFQSIKERNQSLKLFIYLFIILFFTIAVSPFQDSSLYAPSLARSLSRFIFSLSLYFSLSPPFRFSLPFSFLSATARRLKLTQPNKQTKTLFSVPNTQASFSLIHNPFPSLSAAAFVLHTLKLSLYLSILLSPSSARISFCFGDIQQPLGGSY